MTAETFKVVGTRQPLVDSWKKVTGSAVYGAESAAAAVDELRALATRHTH